MWRRPLLFQWTPAKTAIYTQARKCVNSHGFTGNLYLSEHVCGGGKREAHKLQIRLYFVYWCGWVSVLFYFSVMVTAIVFSLRGAAVCSGKQREFNLEWRQSLVSRVGWRSAGTKGRRWSSWTHLVNCWGSKHTCQESTEEDTDIIHQRTENIQISNAGYDTLSVWSLASNNALIRNGVSRDTDHVIEAKIRRVLFKGSQRYGAINFSALP